MGTFVPNSRNFYFKNGRTILLFFGLILFYSEVNAQCTGNVYDPGGSGANYGNNANWTVTYTATSGNLQKITFTTFSIESGYDFLYIYDGPNASSPLLGTYSGTTLPPTTTASGQTLTLKFTSDESVTSTGWAATLACVAGCSNTTVGGTIVGDQTLCGSYYPTNITSSVAASGGSGTLSYQWESSLDNSTWTDISGATSVTYDPSTITQTTYHKRESKISTCSSWGDVSNTITNNNTIIWKRTIK